MPKNPRLIRVLFVPKFLFFKKSVRGSRGELKKERELSNQRNDCAVGIFLKKT